VLKAYLLVAAVVVVTSWAVLQSIGLIPEHSEYCSHNDETDKKECARYRTEFVVFLKIIKALDEHSELLTALFTLVVGGFTWLLWYSTHKLWEESRTAGETAKKSADAAADLARVNIKSRLPVVGWVGAKLIDIPGWEAFGINIDSRRDPIPPGMLPAVCEPLVLLKNAGPTNIAVTFVRFRWVVAHRLPPQPFYDGMVPAGYFMEVGMQWIKSEEYLTITQEEEADIKSGKRHLWLYGFCRYDDFLDEWHDIRFCYRWDTKHGFVRGDAGPYWETDHQKRY
jgi:hypothetical protein